MCAFQIVLSADLFQDSALDQLFTLCTLQVMRAAFAQNDRRSIIQIVVTILFEAANLNIQLFRRLVSNCQIQSIAGIQSAHIKSQIS